MKMGQSQCVITGQIYARLVSVSLVPSLPDLFNVWGDWEQG